MKFTKQHHFGGRKFEDGDEIDVDGRALKDLLAAGAVAEVKKRGKSDG